MFRRLVMAVLSVAALSCAWATPSWSKKYSTYPDYIQYESAVRLDIKCDQFFAGTGSGVIVSGRHVLTAKHVAVMCGDLKLRFDAICYEDPGLCKELGVPSLSGDTTFVARLSSGLEIGMIVDVLAGNDVDAARLVVPGVVAPFATWADVSYRKPRIGERLCSIGGQAQDEHSFRKCGEVAFYLDGPQAVISGLGAVHGNSGSPIFDSDGDVVAILWGARAWWNGAENVTIAFTSVAWRSIVPEPEPDLGF